MVKSSILIIIFKTNDESCPITCYETGLSGWEERGAELIRKSVEAENRNHGYSQLGRLYL